VKFVRKEVEEKSETIVQIPVTLFPKAKYEGWNFNSGNYLFTTDTK
jgi:hypothetical protein